LDRAERLLRGLGAIMALAALASIFVGIARGLRRAPGRVAGRAPGVLRSPRFFVLASAGYFGLGYLAWRRIPLALSPLARLLALICGALLTFGGLGVVLWGRLALGKMYYVSSSAGAQLFADHRLVTIGPYRLVRHPMYLGILLAAVGGALLYRTWAMLLLVLTGLGLTLRARREEQALAAEFGQAWRDYRRRTPAFLPRVRSSSAQGGCASLPDV
jgi:protein-S-isoprenylcysteine O-methyltransferase Ste14